MVPQRAIRSRFSDRERREGLWRADFVGLLSIACVFVLACSGWLGGHCTAQSDAVAGTAVVLPSVAGGSDAAQGLSPQAKAVTDICQHIYRGQFETAGRLATEAKALGEDRIELLSGAIQQYDELKRRRQTDRTAAFAEQIKELDKLKVSVDLKAVKAHRLAKDDTATETVADEPNEPNDITDVLAVLTKAAEFGDEQQTASLLSQPFVKDAIDASIKDSIALEGEGKWLDAYTTYYYWLQAIDPNNQGYADYADELLEKAAIAASFQDSPCETRQERYSGVEDWMFEKAIQALHLHYVNSIDYPQMGLKALDQCKLLAEVLSTAFIEGLDSDNGNSFVVPEPAQVTAWSVALAGLRDGIESSSERYGRDEFLETMEKVLALNKATVQLPRRPLIAHFAKAALETLDPYTVMVWPREVQDFEKLMMNEFSGIGIEISKPHGLLTVGSLLPDTPAYRSGLDAGDVIEAVDGVPTKDMSLICAVKKITGPKGTRVTLAVKRSNKEKAENMTITRDKIVVPTIRGWQRTESGEWLYMIDEINKIGYVRITSFASDTAGDFEKTLRALESKGLKGLIIDLRFNTGGLLDSAVDIVDKFISEGLIVRTQPKANMIPIYEYAHRGKTHGDYPLVILINSSSASASEIVAGALADPKHERAILVGTRTHGKGSVQGITHYPGGGAQLKYTMAYYHLPSNQRVKSREEAKKDGTNDWGVGPDVEVTLTSKEMGDMIDVQRDNDVLVQAGRDVHSRSYTKRTLDETLQADAQLAVGLLIARTKLIEAGALAKN